MKPLERAGAPNRFGSGRADLVAAIQAVEVEFLGVRRPGRGPHAIRAVLVKPRDHLKKVLRRGVLVREDEGAQPLVHRGLVIEPGRHVG